jgi:dual specificity protein kinase YAK1
MSQYGKEHRTHEQASKQYFKQTKLKDIIMDYPLSKKATKQSDIDKGEFIDWMNCDDRG